MYSLASRTAIKRSSAAVASTSRSFAPVAVAAPRYYSSTVHGNDPEVLEQEKQRNLRNEQHKTSTPVRNAPGWNEYLASASEAAIKADRGDTEPHELAEHTVKHMKERHHTVETTTTTPGEGSSSKSETVNEERVDAREASYEKDEVGGPLKKGGVGASA
ncbi:hypothetical protein EIP91_004417 [Steccherinum ochraceum]|uniref:Uncharacterized protein n=1 Tax=Steccherinum ochraceum TaxID=92696 RepID=A0A4R0RR26_9APHY|nr:hypothetical protein EIP91_004417 [Steccherinum ochraceum]